MINEAITINSYIKSTEEITNFVKEYIDNNNCRELKIDISALNFVDACKVGLACSIYHFTKYQKGLLELFVKDKESLNLMKAMLPQNVNLEVKENCSQKVVQFKKKFSTSLVK